MSARRLLLAHLSDSHFDERREGVEDHAVEDEGDAAIAPVEDAAQGAGVAVEVVGEVEGVDVVEGRAADGADGHLGDVCEDGVGEFLEEGGGGARQGVEEEEEEGPGETSGCSGGQGVNEGFEQEGSGDGDALPGQHERHGEDDSPSDGFGASSFVGRSVGI